MGSQAATADGDDIHIHVRMRGPQGHLVIDGPWPLLERYMDSRAQRVSPAEGSPLGPQTERGGPEPAWEGDPDDPTDPATNTATGPD